MDKVGTIIMLLESVLKNKLNPVDALREWPDNIDNETDEVIRKAWHELHHFYADGDIRIKDANYDKYQRGLLRSYISDIRNKYSV